MVKIKSVWCEVEREDGSKLNTMVPLDVFALHFSQDVMDKWGFWGVDYTNKLKKLETK